jgi:predicted regulator of Ras-like GTPase activity (Roadblock/LC7/MglB family)
MSKFETLEAILETLRHAIPGVEGVVVASTDGLPIAHSLPAGQDPHGMAALAATLYDHGRRIGEGVGSGAFREAVIQGDAGRAFLYPTRSNAVLAVVTGPLGPTGLIRHEARKLAAVIAPYL